MAGDGSTGAAVFAPVMGEEQPRLGEQILNAELNAAAHDTAASYVNSVSTSSLGPCKVSANTALTSAAHMAPDMTAGTRHDSRENSAQWTCVAT